MQNSNTEIKTPNSTMSNFNIKLQSANYNVQNFDIELTMHSFNIEHSKQDHKGYMKVSSLEVEGCDGNVSSFTFIILKGSLLQLPTHKKVQRESKTTR